MNVCNEGGPIVAFRESPESRRASEIKRNRPTDATSIDHIRAREFAERAAAKRAACAAARRVHQELALAYSRIIRRAGGE